MNLIGPVTSSGLKTASAQITNMSGFLHSIIINPPNTGIATIELFNSEDSNTAGKLSLGRFSCAAGQNSLYFAALVPMAAERGIYASVLSGSAAFVVGYSI